MIRNHAQKRSPRCAFEALRTSVSHTSVGYFEDFSSSRVSLFRHLSPAHTHTLEGQVSSELC